MNIIIARIGRCEVVEFAANELEKYLLQIDPKSFVERRVYNEKDEKKENVIWVGLDGSLQPSFDDTVKIDVKGGASAEEGWVFFAPKEQRD